MTYERPNITRLTPYTPGEQPAGTPTDRSQPPIIKLNTNENPYPPAQPVLDAIRNVSPDALRRYPPPTASAFRQAAADAHNLTPDHIIATNGGDELLRLAITVYCEPRGTYNNTDSPPVGWDKRSASHQSQSPTPGAGIGITDPTYSLYEVLAAIHNTPITRMPLNDDFSIPDDYPDRLNAANARLALIVNPHAPSGRLQPINQLADFAQRFNGILLIDEAYTDFAESNALELLDPARNLTNVLLLRTLSKGYSLAGLRFGYGLAHPTIITTLNKAKDSYNTDALAQAAAVAALQSRDHAAKTWQAVTAERTRLTDRLTDLGHRVHPSQSNFLLTTPTTNAKTLYQNLKAANILVRYFDHPRLTDKLRITVGTPDENNQLLNALEKLQ